MRKFLVILFLIDVIVSFFMFYYLFSEARYFQGNIVFSVAIALVFFVVFFGLFFLLKMIIDLFKSDFFNP